MRRGRALRLGLTVAAGTAAAAGLALYAYRRLKQSRRERRAMEQMQAWCGRGPAKEPIVECEVPVEHGLSDEDPELDVVEVPIGLVLECERLAAALREALLPRAAITDMCCSDDLDIELIDAYKTALEVAAVEKSGMEEATAGGGGQTVPTLHLPWIDLAALAQLTYWYDRRPCGEDAEPSPESSVSADPQDQRPTDAKFGRWTKKVSREKVVYGAVALRYRTRGHLGQEVFRRPAGVDITRLGTLRRAAALCGHGALLQLAEETMEKLKPTNVAKIPWDEVKQHTSKDDLWLLIDGRVYDVTPFLGLHPGGGHLIVEASGKDATSKFEQTHGEGLRYSLRLLNQFFIGDCVGFDEAEPADPEFSCTPEFLTTLRSITGALHSFDEAKATGEAQGILRS